MPKAYCIELGEVELLQILGGLEIRADAWEKTADYHRTSESPAGFIIEESNDAEEASKIAAHYRSIIAKIQRQREEQS